MIGYDRFLKGDEAGSIYANVGFNRFAESATALPEGAEAVELSARMLRECYFDPTRRRLRPAAATALPSGAALKIVDGEGAPFVAYAGDGACAVYRLPPDGYVDDRDVTGDLERDRLFYTDKVVEIDDPLRVRRGGDRGRKRVRRWPTSKARISVAFHSFRLIFRRVTISSNGLEAQMVFLECARAEHPR